MTQVTLTIGFLWHNISNQVNCLRSWHMASHLIGHMLFKIEFKIKNQYLQWNLKESFKIWLEFSSTYLKHFMDTKEMFDSKDFLNLLHKVVFNRIWMNFIYLTTTKQRLQSILLHYTFTNDLIPCLLSPSSLPSLNDDGLFHFLANFKAKCSLVVHNT